MATVSSGAGADACATPDETPTPGAESRMSLIYETHSEPLFRFLLRLSLGARHIAEDLLQETMVRAWRNIDHLSSDPETQRRWLFTVARRIAIDAARARQARPTEVGAVDVSRMPTTTDHVEEIVAVHTVHDALPRLKPEQRTVLIDLYFHGRSTAEIAARLDIPEGTVKSRAHYGLRALRAIVGPTDGV
ncbi:sigma-70 family RNA polymerase sigma factor [Micromonospora sp. NPDC049903]|uniref:sigma-70 family RNA polymerase sigma factor n=1 Tax=Micromonospora sp. NPDC049903 TaxID=3364276 RepID=UPI0037A50758